jgi:transcription-repair coupling factor (superfamily II helicase)
LNIVSKSASFIRQFNWIDEDGMNPGADPAAEIVALSTLPSILTREGSWGLLCAALGKNESGTIDGAWGSSSTLAVAALAQSLPGPLLVLVPGMADVSAWAEDLASFTGTRPTLFPAFDSWPVVASKGRIAPETAGRLRTLQSLSPSPLPLSPEERGKHIILAPIAAMLQPVPARDEMAGRGRTIAVGETLAPGDLAQWLIDRGYKRVESVEYHAEFAKRGGIVDVFPPDATDPIRFEFFGDEIESIRSFAAVSQRSLETRQHVTLLGVHEGAGETARGFFTDYLPDNAVICLIEPGDLKEQARHFFDRVSDPTGLFAVADTFRNLMARPTVAISSFPRPSVEASVHLHVESIERFSGNVKRVRDELDAVAGNGRVLIACQSEAEVHRLTEVLKAGTLSESHRLKLVTGHVRAGFRLVEANVVVLGSHELFHKDLLPPGMKAPVAKSGRKIESRAIDSFLDLTDGDYVVHIAHGIARFRGMKMLAKIRNSEFGVRNEEPEEIDESAFRVPHSALEENLILEFRDGVMLYVPASRIDLVQRYVGGTQLQPELSKLGGTAWGRKKDKVAEAVRDMAAEMIQIQAMRAALPGQPLPPDTEWQEEFEAAFPFRETPDQATAIEDLKHDLEKPKPMDRLLCGDVGFGKTEVALRAVFKAIDNGKQVAVLVPTTVLAEQHARTFSQRLAEYPFVVEVLSRFKTAGQQKEILKRVAAGDVDVVIGTHRLVSKDVKFKDLGLVVIDEEQKFGVEAKEKLKHLRAQVHILTMTATPIPRTLHGALVGVREISSLETPPANRHPVETRIIRWDESIIRHAIHRELNRGGQIYFVHNRVHDILDIAARVAHIAPDAKIVVGHGQMDDAELEATMVKFVKKEADILVATTIVESGLDIPNANTMFIHEADRYGLADLHQLRGRVGRTSTRAYAYLIVDEHKLVNPNAQRRLKAIEEFAELGSGFKIAMRDLEIRGAGNILGTEQSGHIAAVGYEMYCTLLENAVRQLRNLPPKEAVEVNVDLPWPAFLPRDYVPGQKLRIEVYRRLARLRELPRLAEFREELKDRYGPPPEPAEWLLRTTEIRLLCVRWQIAGVHRDGPDIVFSYRNRKKADDLAKGSHGRLKVVDEKSAYLRLVADEETPEAMYELLKAILEPPARKSR